MLNLSQVKTGSLTGEVSVCVRCRRVPCTCLKSSRGSFVTSSLRLSPRDISKHRRRDCATRACSYASRRSTTSSGCVRRLPLASLPLSPSCCCGLIRHARSLPQLSKTATLAIDAERCRALPTLHDLVEHLSRAVGLDDEDPVGRTAEWSLLIYSVLARCESAWSFVTKCRCHTGALKRWKKGEALQ